MYSKTLLWRYGIAFVILAVVLVVSGWRSAWFYTMPLAVLCSLGVPASKRMQVLFVLGWVGYLGGVAWITSDYYSHFPAHRVSKPLKPIEGSNQTSSLSPSRQPAAPVRLQ